MLLFLTLKISYNQTIKFGHIHLLLLLLAPPRSIPSPTTLPLPHPWFHVCFFFSSNPQIPVYTVQTLMGMRHLLQHGQSFRDYTLEGNWGSLPQKHSAIDSFSAGDRGYIIAFHSMLAWWLAWSWADLVQAVIAALSSQVQWPCHIQKTRFQSGPSWPLAGWDFPTPSFEMFPEIGVGRGLYDIVVAKHSTDSLCALITYFS